MPGGAPVDVSVAARLEESCVPIPGGAPTPGGEPLWPGKLPNPGGRPYGEAAWAVSISDGNLKGCTMLAMLTSIGIVCHLELRLG
jgi:hypothetical protein